MRIWAFPSVYPYDHPGMAWNGIFAHRQYKGLIENGAELKVIIPVPWHPAYPLSLLHSDWKRNSKFKYPRQRVYDGITVYHPRIANMKPARFAKKVFRERYIDSIVHFFHDHKIELDPTKDIFYAQWIPDAALVQEAAHILGVKSAVLGIGDDIIVYARESTEYFDLLKKTLTEADLRVVNAMFLGREANKILGTHLHFDVVYFGVDYDRFKPATGERAALIKKEYGIPGDKVVILTVAAALKRKGWLDLFDALKTVKKVTGNFVLVAVHAAPNEVDIAKEAEQSGLAANFVNLGEIKPEQLNKLYDTADIFCLPSHWEGLATVIIEAMSSGVAVITTDVGGHAEIIETGVNGILIPPEQCGILADSLLSLISDQEMRSALGRNAREYTVNKLGNAAGNAGKLYKIMDELLSGQTR
jgi:glycosyltransferase involved in cell wall biosynthesis